MGLTYSHKSMDYILLVTLAAIFGGSFMLTKIALIEIPATTLVLIRLFVGALIFLVSMVVVGQKLPVIGGIWFYIFGTALFGNTLPFYLISWGQEKVDAGLAAILMATMPLMTIFIAHFFTGDEKLNRYKIIGFISGLLGVAVMIGVDKLGSLGEEAVRQYAISGGALCYAISAVMIKSLTKLPRIAMMAAVMTVSAVLILPFSVFSGEFAEVVQVSLIYHGSLYAAIILGILPTALGTVMIFVIVTRQGASFLSQINFMVPVFGVFWGMVFLHEVLPNTAFIALALILAGVAIARINTDRASSQRKETVQ